MMSDAKLTPEQEAYVNDLTKEQKQAFEAFAQLPHSSRWLALRYFVSLLPLPPPDFTDFEKSIFIGVRNKIQCTLLPDGRVACSFELLSDLELFALGREMLHTSPDELGETLVDAQRPRRKFNLDLIDDAELRAQFSNTTISLPLMPGKDDDAIAASERTRQAMRKHALKIIHANNFTPGRDKDSKSDKVKHIFELAKDNPELSAKELLALANKSIIGDMREGTFGNHVTDARKLYPKEKKARKQ